VNSTDSAPLLPPPAPAPKPNWRLLKYGWSLAPVLVFTGGLVGWLAYLLYLQADSWRRVDEANVKEWLNEARVFRLTLPELARRYARQYEQLRQHRHAQLASANGEIAATPDLANAERQTIPEALANDLAETRDQIIEQFRALTAPIRMVPGQLPLFPEVYHLKLTFAPEPRGDAADDADVDPWAVIEWVSPVPKPSQQGRGQIRTLRYALTDPDGSNPTAAPMLLCEYRLHAFNKAQRDEDARQAGLRFVGIVLAVFAFCAAIWSWRYLRREQIREFEEIQAQTALEHALVQALEQRLLLHEAERQKRELDQKLLEQQLKVEKTERELSEQRSQIQATISIAAGSYAHNVKNLLVRPNDLLARCLEQGGLPPEQTQMLREVREILGTATQRLEQILKAVRRDPSQIRPVRLDVNHVVRAFVAHWQAEAAEKWQMQLTLHAAEQPLWVQADPSQLEQVLENLLFNARDATFEMRNHLREQARALPPDQRKRALIETASWQGQAHFTTRREGQEGVLEVSDNGIGMTPEVRDRCTQPYFTTKRDNAVYEGHAAGTGLGLSFVASVLRQHQARLEIDSTPHRGTTFRLRFSLHDAAEDAAKAGEHAA
jgi:signal transduction histidine kinase